MRVVKVENGFLLYIKIFKQLAANQHKVILWQVSPETGGRQISEMYLNTFNMETKKVYFSLNGFSLFKTDLPLYGYVEAGAFIFKSIIESIKDSTICMTLPDQLSLLEESDNFKADPTSQKSASEIYRLKTMDTSFENQGPDYMRVKSLSQRTAHDQEFLNQEFGLSLDQEDKLFADKRESPRARPKDDKFVKILSPNGNGPMIYRLFDLSRGGLGFVSLSETEFSKGTDIQIMGFNEFQLDDPLIGKVMSIRPMDEHQVEFKIGVKFSEGQD
jgi:hypothetical protein